MSLTNWNNSQTTEPEPTSELQLQLYPATVYTPNWSLKRMKYNGKAKICFLEKIFAVFELFLPFSLCAIILYSTNTHLGRAQSPIFSLHRNGMCVAIHRVAKPFNVLLCIWTEQFEEMENLPANAFWIQGNTG